MKAEAGSLTQPWASALMQEVQRSAPASSDDSEAYPIAESLLVRGFPTKHSGPESAAESRAVQLLVRIFSISLANVAFEFRYFDLLDHLGPTLPNLSQILATGRPWFGETCQSECTHGVIVREELATFLETADERLDRELRKSLESAANHPCDLWFTT